MDAISLLEPKLSSVHSKNNSWEAIRARTNNWISDFEFLKLEIIFFQRVLDRVVTFATSHDSERSFPDLKEELNDLELRCDLFVRVIKYHQKQVGSLIENPFPQNSQSIVDDHRDLERRIAEFMNDVRFKKSMIYKMVKDNVAPDKVIHLLDSTNENDMIDD